MVSTACNIHGAPILKCPKRALQGAIRNVSPAPHKMGVDWKSNGTNFPLRKPELIHLHPPFGGMRKQGDFLCQQFRMKKIAFINGSLPEQLLRQKFILRHRKAVTIRKLVFINGGKGDF